MAQGKRAGTRRGAKPQRVFRPVLLGLAVGVTAAVVAWGYLVYAAIDFGTEARSGRSGAWWFLGLASLGAVACLFIGLILIAQLSRAVGVTRDPSSPSAEAATLDRGSAPANDSADGVSTDLGTTSIAPPPPGHDPDPPSGSHRAVR